MSKKDAITFGVVLLALMIVHQMLFGLDDADVTQFWVFAAMVTVLRAMKRQRDAA